MPSTACRAWRQGGRARPDLRRGRSLRADARLAQQYRRARDCPHGAAGRGEHGQARREAVRAGRPAAGHRACGRPGAGPDAAGPADRLRRQPHFDAWRAWRLCVRHRRLRSGACADDADDLAKEAAADADHCRWTRRARHHRQGHHASDHRAHRRRRRDRLRGRIRRLRDPRAVDRRPADAVQHVDRSGRALRHGRAGRKRRSPISRAGPMRRRATRLRPGGRGMVGAGKRSRRGIRPRGRRSTQRVSRRSSPGARAPRMRCRSMPACPIPRASRTRRAPSICATRSTTWASRRASKLTDIAVDRVFIGSCTNSRIEDLRAAAAVLAGRTSKVPGLVSAGSSLIKRQAEEEGLDRIFRDAGLEWGESGCSMCVGINGDLVAPGRALRLDHQPQFPRPAGAGRAHASDVARDGGGCGGRGSSRRRAAAAGRAEGLSHGQVHQAHRHGLSDQSGQPEHRPDSCRRAI